MITITLAALSAEDKAEVEIGLTEGSWSVAEATAVTGPAGAFNSFGAPDRVKEETFTSFEETESGIKALLSPASVTLLRLKRKEG